MCVVCVLLDKDKITKAEAKNAFWEQVSVTNVTEDELAHYQEIYGILDREEKTKE